MCQDCGCSEIDAIAIDGVLQHNRLDDHLHDHNPLHRPNHPPVHNHSHPLEQTHEHPTPIQVISIHQGVLVKNDRIAEQNRKFLWDRNVLALNLLSSPGAGKTALIERMAKDLLQASNPLQMAVIVGDLATDNDAQRLRQAGTPAVQITTGNACHLEAEMVAQAMQRLDWQGLNLLVIENVGNLVCPASYDLGETLRVVVLSVTEGEDKPLKYPTMFKSANIVIINKIDIAAVVGCDLELAITNIQRVAPQAQLFQVSARTGEGMEAWYDALRATLLKTAKPAIAGSGVLFP